MADNPAGTDGKYVSVGLYGEVGTDRLKLGPFKFALSTACTSLSISSCCVALAVGSVVKSTKSSRSQEIQIYKEWWVRYAQ